MDVSKERLTVSEQIRLLRDQSAVSAQDLAQLVGASLVAVEGWERNRGTPSRRHKVRIDELVNKCRRGEAIRRPPVVLQNGTFASRGSDRSALNLDHSTPDLFALEAKVTLKEQPQKSAIAALVNGFAPSPERKDVVRILSAHPKPARTPSQARKIEVSAGKNTYTYDAHTYHTKVPPQGIVEILEEYLPEGGLMFDPFSGSGMTGVAALVAGVDVILNELSPAACFISHNFTESVSPTRFASALHAVMEETRKTREALYQTTCRECGEPTEILYTVWSYEVSCPHCQHMFVLWDHCRSYGRTVREHKILREFPCPSCQEVIRKQFLTRLDAVPVMLGYKCCAKSQIEHKLTPEDHKRISLAETDAFLEMDFFPTTALPGGVNLNQPKKHGLSSVDLFYSRRNLSAMSCLWRVIHKIEDKQLASAMAFVFTSLYQRVTKLSEFRFWGGSSNAARYNVPFVFNEANVFLTFKRKAANIFDHLETTGRTFRARKAIVCNSATRLAYLPDNSIDFIFTDPPFGANINYSEMNLLWESWLNTFTDNTNEAIVNKAQGKTNDDYRCLMTQCLAECFRVLRPGHWMLLVFMNSSMRVWHALKDALRESGFVMERLDIFDKQHGTDKQFVSDNTAGCDLVLHCRKPVSGEGAKTDTEFSSREESIAMFLRRREGGIPITNYLHVTRDSEVDLRRLYSEWLAYALPRDHELSDFALFRNIIGKLVRE